MHLGQIRNGGFRGRLLERRLAARQVASAVTSATPFLTDYASSRGVVDRYQTTAGRTLSEREKIIQKVVLARDYDALFKLIPLQKWKRNWNIGKYSFTENGARRFVPFTKQDIRRFIFSPYYTIQPGYTCPDSQREAGVEAHWEKTAGHKAKYPPSHYLHIWPMYPGGGYPGQRYGCEKYQPSTWVKIRKKVYIAVAVVAAVYLGPIIASKIGSMGAAEAAGAGAVEAGAGGIVGAGAKVGVTAVKIGKTAESISLFSKIKTGTSTLLGYVNKARTVNAIVHGEIPPPPIGIGGNSFREWAMIVAKKEIIDEAKEKAAELGVEYIQKKMTEREEAKLRAEIAGMQRRLEALIPPETPMQPDAQVPLEVQEKMVQEKTEAKDLNNILAVAVPLGIGALLLTG